MKASIFTPAVTIMKQDGKIDREGNHLIIEHLIAGGVDGIIPLGSMGEFPFFSVKEKRKMLDDYIRTVDGRVELIAGTGDRRAEKAVELSNHVLEQGIRGVMIMSEFYFAMSQEDLYRYYAYMAENIRGRIYIYNFPARSGSCLSAETLVRLACDYENIAGLKDTVTDFSHTREVLEKVLPVRPDFEVFSGYDNQFLMNIDHGGVGGIGSFSNIVPALWSGMVKAVNEGDRAKAEESLAVIEHMMPFYSLESNAHKLIKEVLRYKGFDIGTYSHFPFNTLKAGSLEKALELIG